MHALAPPMLLLSLQHTNHPPSSLRPCHQQGTIEEHVSRKICSFAPCPHEHESVRGKEVSGQSGALQDGKGREAIQNRGIR